MSDHEESQAMDFREVVKRLASADVDVQRKMIEAERNLTVGLNVMRIRRSKRLSQEELAQRMGVKQSAISRYESGAGRSYTLEQIVRLAGALAVEPIALLQGALSVPEPYRRAYDESRPELPIVS